MKTVVEPLEGNKVKLSVEVDQAEFESALDSAYRRIAQDVRIPGFRPGKAPRRVIEARLGANAAREQALRDSLPEYYQRAVRENDVDAIAPPEIEVGSDGRDGPLTFDAVVEVRPTVSVAGYAGLQVTVPSPEVTDEDVDAQVDRLRDTFAELQDTSRPARDGDHVTIDLTAYRHGERFEDLSAGDLTYEVGSEIYVAELDENLRGARVGDILKFNAETPGHGEISFQVLLKGVKEKVLPEVTDEWAAEASEFSTVGELRADIRQRLEAVRKVQARMGLRDAALQALVKLVPDEMPDALVQAEMEQQLHDLGHRLDSQKIDFRQYLEAIGQDQQGFLDEVRASAAEAVKADLGLRALADAESLEAGEEDVENEVARLAESYGLEAEALRSRIEGSDRTDALLSELRKGKALAWLMDHVEVVDEEGRPVDRALLEIENPVGESLQAETEPPADPEPQAAEVTN
ncbi:MAG TPA: trigger factor [Acidimicrobiales bacterium]|nr:trigger factor [Acidimicrobiales bacterium]